MLASTVHHEETLGASEGQMGAKRSVTQNILVFGLRFGFGWSRNIGTAFRGFGAEGLEERSVLDVRKPVFGEAI